MFFFKKAKPPCSALADCVTHWNIEPIAWMFNDAQSDVQVGLFKEITQWHSQCAADLEVLKGILAFKTKANGSDPIMSRATPLRKKLEELSLLSLLFGIYEIFLYGHHVKLTVNVLGDTIFCNRVGVEILDVTAHG